MLSTKEAKRHTPPWLKKEDAPVYLLRSGSVIERSLVEAELAGEYQAGRVFAFELMEAFRSGIVTLLGQTADADQILGLAGAELALEKGETLPPDEAKMLDEAREELARHWPPYRSIVARQSRRKELAPVIAFRRLCVGWENVSATFQKGPDGLIPLALLEEIDPLELISAGNAAYGMLYPSEADEGNSRRPSPSDEAPRPLTSRAPKAAGKSTGKGGRKTPA